MKRSTMRMSAALLSAAAIGVGVGVGVAGAHDSALDDANAHLVKASALLRSAAPDNADTKAQKKFAKAVAKALTDIRNAEDQIGNAIAASDGP